MCSSHVRINNHPFWQMQREVHSWATSSQKSLGTRTLASSLVIWSRGHSDFPSCKTSRSSSSCSEKWHVIIIMSFGFSNKQSATDVQLGFSGRAASGREWDQYRGRCWHFYRTKPWTAGRITGMWGVGDNNRRIRNKDRHLFLNLLILCWMISYNRNKWTEREGKSLKSKTVDRRTKRERNLDSCNYWFENTRE